MHINTDTHDTGATPSPEQRIVFIDCEFTDLADPKLLSIGLVADDGRELYVELTGDSHLASASTFVLDTVAPQFGLMPHQETSLIDIGKRVGDWLLALGDTSVTVCYDYHADMDLLEHTLRSAGVERNRCRRPICVLHKRQGQEDGQGSSFAQARTRIRKYYNLIFRRSMHPQCMPQPGWSPS